MASNDKPGPERLKEFMLKQLDSETCPGMVWINRQDGKFKIPWYRIDKIKPAEIPDKFKIFLEWEKNRPQGNYKENDQPDYKRYKERLRNALNGHRDFILLSEVDASQSEPYKVYQISISSNPNCNTPVSDSTPVFNGEFFQCEKSQAQTQKPESNLPTFLQPQIGHSQSLIGVGGSSEDTVYTPAGPKFQESNIPYPDQSQNLAHAVQIEGQGYAREPPERRFSRNKQMNSSINFSSPMDVDLQPPTQQSNIYVAPTAFTTVQQPFYVKQDKMSSADLSDDSSMEALGACGFDLIKYLTDDDNQTCAQISGAVSPQATAQLSPDSEAIHKSDILHRESPNNHHKTPVNFHMREPDTSEITHKMRIVVQYGRRYTKTEAMNEIVGEEGCRLYFGDKVLDNTLVDEEMYGPKTVKELQLPSVQQKLPNATEKEKEYISQTLENMSRGLVLTFQDGDIYAHRKCLTRVFTCDATNYKSEALKKNLLQKVFDFKEFKESLKRGCKQDPYFILTFGGEARGSLDNVVVFAWVIHISAEKAIEIHSTHPNSVNSLEPLISDPNSMDKIEKNFKEILKVLP